MSASKVGGPGRIKWYTDWELEHTGDHNPDCGGSHSREEQKEAPNVVLVVQLLSRV